jgi:CRP/FNR family transcriptional regulator, cyclic AMP receptor protein
VYSISLSDIDPELTEASPQLASLSVEVIVAPAGEWSIDDEGVTPERAPGGLLVLEGLLAREVRVGAQVAMELLGPTDTLRPWVRMGADSSIGVESSWTVHDGAMLGVLDTQFMRRAAESPRVLSLLMDRLVLRTRWLVLQIAICTLRGVDQRLLMTFWHLADRWGRVTSEGVTLALPLTHHLLAQVVGARRPTVSTALASLRGRGLVERTADGLWLLKGAPPPELRHLEQRTSGVG